MKKKQKQVMETLNEKEQKDVMGGYAPPPKDENKSLIEKIFEELNGGGYAISVIESEKL
ncbi:hypothetical protein [uncultured Bacteroides sp.]|uniref:hypothetical protein n=1 Tax=uncultured Bacteroides sp. TaxID=162156 RepID=UPI0025E737DE|nr:hypothetical protein [uncultured Bacteroides sp.]